MLGVNHDNIQTLPYDRTWADKFHAEKQLISDSLENYIGIIEHVGSTAIIGADAKPIIDIMASIENVSEAKKHIEAIKSLGYEHIPVERDDGLLFIRTVEGMETHRFYFVLKGTSYWNDVLTFRDRLNENHDLVEQYNLLKRQLLNEFSQDWTSYTHGKSEFVKSVVNGTSDLG